jgi:hypothetical protein
MPRETQPSRLYYIDGTDLDALRRIARRLYDDMRRLDANEMRDTAARLELIARNIESLPVQE